MDNGLDLLDDAVYLQNVEKEGKNGDILGDGIYERVHIWPTTQEGKFNFILWRLRLAIYGQPSIYHPSFCGSRITSINDCKIQGRQMVSNRV
ncbi:hypothetical protein [Escherichia coli]|uniref:hypothetical protein n=1 Tax=Escherichia coli TaxID=562 RepID=UPI00388DBA12